MPSRGIEIYQYPCTADAGGLPPPLVGLPSIEWVFDQSNLGPDLSAIARRIDLSDNGNDFTQTTESLKPTVQTNVWSAKAAFFDGTDDLLESGIVSIGTGELTLGWCGYANWTGANLFLAGDSASGIGDIKRGANAEINFWNGSAVVALAAIGSWPNTTKLYMVVRRDASGNWTCRRDGVDITSGTPNDAVSMQIDRWSSGTAVAWHCPARFLASAHYTGADLSALEGWLASIATAA